MKDYITYKVDGITLANSMGGNLHLIKNSTVNIDGGMDTEMGMDTGMDMGMGTELPIEGSGAKDPLLSSWVFVIGITTLTLAISVGIGILLAKRKIKKGFELYED